MKPVTEFRYDVLRDCSLLEKDKTFRNLYKLICHHGDIAAAMWMEGEEVKSLTFNELMQLSDNWAAEFQKCIGTTGRVCICLESCKEWFPLFWGLVRSGHDVMAVDASLPDEKVARLMGQCSCNILVTGTDKMPGGDITVIKVQDLVDSPEVKGYEPVWGHDIALCTSGTTSDSRIFVYDEETICYLALFSAKVYNENHNLIDNECFRTLAFLPFHHILGFAAIFIWSHFLGDTTVYLKDRAPQTIIKTMHACEVNQIVCVPLLVNSLCRALKANVKKKGYIAYSLFVVMKYISLGIQSIAPKYGLKLAGKMFRNVQEQMLGTKIKSLVIGGSRTDPHSLRTLNAIGYFTICGYGMTETAITGFETSYRLGNRVRGSIGAPMAYTEYRVKEGGNVGELQVKGKGVHSGRFVDGKMLPPDLEDGWFSTGDIIRIHPGRQMYFIEGRLKEVIISESGENVYPDELEDIFSGIEGINRFTALGLPKKAGYEDVALVAEVGDKIDDADFLKQLSWDITVLNKTLPVYKRLTRALVTSEELPLTTSFKVKRLALKSMIAEGDISYKELDLATKRADIVAMNRQKIKAGVHENKYLPKVLEIYGEALAVKAKKIDPDADFIEDLGGDSLQVLSITTRLQEEFGVVIPRESYAECTTARSTAQLISNLVNGKKEEKKRVPVKPVTAFEDTPEFKSFKQRIDSMTADGAENPYFVCHDSPLLDTSVVGGRRLLDFGSYNYVGMSGRKEVNEAAKAAIDKYGTSASGSRLLAGEKPVHGELERAIAEWKHAESAIVLVGGHSTNVTVVGNFCGKNDLIVYDALAHNSIEQGCKLSDAASIPFPHSDVKALDRLLAAQRKYYEKVLIVIEGVYSMDGDIAPVPEFIALKKKYGCFLMVDEAHSACVLGPTGGGVDEYFGLASDDIDLKYGTLSKGLGTCGGYIAGKRNIVEYFRYNLPGFVFSVGMSPALAAGSLEAIRLVRTDPSIMESLHNNIKCFADEARRLHLDICLGGNAAVIPVLVGKDEDAFALSNELNRRGILVPPAVYPAVPKGKARLRFDVISEHKPEQIILALNTLVEAAKDLGITLPERNY